MLGEDKTKLCVESLSYVVYFPVLSLKCFVRYGLVTFGIMYLAIFTY